MEEKLPILGSERTTFYRNKLEFTFSNKKWLTEEEIQSGASFDCMNGVGFHIPGMFDKVLDIHKCWLQEDISTRSVFASRILPISEGISFLRFTEPRGIRSYVDDPYGIHWGFDGRIGFLP